MTAATATAAAALALSSIILLLDVTDETGECNSRGRLINLFSLSHTLCAFDMVYGIWCVLKD